MSAELKNKIWNRVKFYLYYHKHYKAIIIILYYIRGYIKYFLQKKTISKATKFLMVAPHTLYARGML